VQRAATFVALLFCMAAACLTLAGIALYEHLDFHLHAQPATMELADPRQKVVVPRGGPDIHPVDVRYVGSRGEVVVPQKLLSGEMALKLAAGARVPITYYTNNPKHVHFGAPDLPMPWGWLALGIVFSATFVYALRLARREYD
jgi:hypothetical protein